MKESLTRPARRWPMFAGPAVLTLTLFAIPVAVAADGQSDLSGARTATASFHDLSARTRSEAVPLVDTLGLLAG